MIYPVAPAMGAHQSTTLMGPKAGASRSKGTAGLHEVPASAGTTESRQ
jgi:hypothetical protein